MSTGESRANHRMNSNDNHAGVIRTTGVLMQHITHLDLKRELDESESQSSESASENFSGHSLAGSSGFVSPGLETNGSGSSGSKLSTNGREARNKAEKNRRDKLNNAIHELSTMVPHVADSPRRVDKTAVLRLAAHGFRLNHIFKNTMGTTERSAITDSFLQMMNGFLITVTLRGQIVLVSSSLEQHLGHCQTDWYGQNILTYTHPDDHIFLKQQLIPVELENLFEIQPVLDSSGEQRARTPEEEELIDRKLREDRRDISIRLARAGPRSEPTVYEIVRLTGYFRRADLAPRGTKVTTFPGLHMIRRARTREESFLPLHTISGNDIVLVGIAHIVKPPKICDRLLEACKTEYKTRHLIDGRIVQCEQAISIVAGYMTDEVSGVSPFSFMHKDDVRWVMVALRQMYDYNKPFGESCYRLMSRTGKFIYMKTRGYLEIDKETNKVHSFVCINTLVSEEDGRRMVSEMKRKFSIIIGQEEVPESDNEEMLVENPMQIERAIMNLITNLESGTTGLPDPSPAPRDDVATRAIAASNGGKGADMRATQSPPLAIIAPKPSTIKSSVTKTMEVIKGSLAQSNKSDSLVSSDDEDDEDGGEVVQKGQSLWIRTVSESHNNSSSSSNNSGSSSGNTNKRSPSGDSGRQPEQKNCRPSVVHRTTSNKSMNLENRCSSSNSSSNSPSMAGGGVGTGSQQHHSPLMIKPEVMDSPMEGSTGHNLTFNSMYSDMANLPPAYAQESSQFLQIKQEVLSNDPLHSPASSTVSSLSYDQPASSSSSTVMGTGNTYTDVLIDDLGSDVGSCGSRRSLVAMKRSLGTSSSSLNQTTKRRRNSRSLDDIPDVSEQSPEFEIPATTTALIDSSEVAGADLIKELPTYFEAIDRSLDRIGNATDELRDQFLSIDNLSIAGTTCDNERDSVFESETTGVARSTDQLAKIVEEQIEQREILYSIKQEFGNQFHSVTSPDYRPGSSRLPQVLEASGDSLNTPKPSQAEPLYLSEEQQQELADSILYDDISFDTNSLKPG